MALLVDWARNTVALGAYQRLSIYSSQKGLLEAGRGLYNIRRTRGTCNVVRSMNSIAAYSLNVLLWACTLCKWDSGRVQEAS